MSQKPHHLAGRMAAHRKVRQADDGYDVRETFTLSREAAREKAAAYFKSYPSVAYFTAVDSWSEEPDGKITFTMRRSRTAD